MLKSLTRLPSRSFIRPAMILILILLAVFSLFLWQLGSLTPGYSPAEKIAISKSNSLSAIIDNPVFAPHKLIQLGFSQFGNTTIFTRLPSVLISMIFIGCFYFVSRRWLGRMIAVLASLIFASMPWIILSSRSATPEIMFISAIVLLAGYVWLLMAKKKTLALIVMMLLIILTAYVPGMIWFLLAGVVIALRKRMNDKEPMRFNAWVFLILLLILSVGLTPLVLASVRDTEIIKTLLLVPSDFPSATEFIKTVAWGGLSYVWSTRDTYPLIIDRLPLLGVSIAALSVFGIYIMWLRAKTELLILTVLMIIALIAYGMSGNLALLSLAFPSFGILMAAGLRYLYAEWRAVFPINPLPKTLSLALVIALVVLNILFGVRYALAAWPNTVSTRNTYVLK